MSNTPVSEEVALINSLSTFASTHAERVDQALQALATQYGQTLSFSPKAALVELGQLAQKVAAHAASARQGLDADRRGHKAPAGDRDRAAEALRAGLSSARLALRNQFGMEQVAQVFPGGAISQNADGLLAMAGEVTTSLVSAGASGT